MNYHNIGIVNILSLCVVEPCGGPSVEFWRFIPVKVVVDDGVDDLERFIYLKKILTYSKGIFLSKHHNYYEV